MTDFTNPLQTYGNLAGALVPGITQKFYQQQAAKYDTIMSKIFSHDVRQYFSITNQFVFRKIKQVIFPFRNNGQQQEIRKPQLYIPIVSLITFILFSSFSEGFLLSRSGKQFEPKIQRRLIICIILTMIEVGVTKFARLNISSIDMGLLDLTAFISYRYVGLSLFTIILTVLQLIDLRIIAYIFLVYFILSQSYFYYLQLKNYLKQRMVTSESYENPTLALIHLGVSIALVLFCYIF